ncbi:ATP-binding protein [bacterium]
MKRVFPVGIPVNKNNFIGREKELSNILNLLLDGQSIVLTAPRRYGKTSIMLHTLNKLSKKKNITCHIDLFSISNKRDLAEKIVQAVLKSESRNIINFFRFLKTNITELIKNAEFKAIIDKFEFVLNFNDPKISEDSLLEEALNFVEKYAKSKKKQIIFAYDEFSEITKLGGDNLIKLMRSKFQMHENVTYLFLGSHESIMKRIFLGKASAFFRFARILHIGFIAEKYFSPYIYNQFKSLHININKQSIKYILTKTKGHPYYTQLLCQLIYYEIKGTKIDITEKIVEKCYANIINIERPVYEEIWSNLGTRKYHREILMNIAQDYSPYIINLPGSSVRRILIYLEDMGYISRDEKNKKYNFIDKFLKDYIASFI